VRPHTAFVCALVLLLALLACAPSFAWLYDGGIPQHAGPVIRDSGTPNWVVQPFTLAADASVTGFSVAMGRILGSDAMGFKVFLTDTLVNAPTNAIAGWEMCPTRSVLEYYDHALDSPMILEQGHAYYLVFAPNNPNFWGSISYSQASGYYGWGSDDHGATWYRMAYPFCVRVDGTYVPEPGVELGLAVGLIGAMLSRRRFVSR